MADDEVSRSEEPEASGAADPWDEVSEDPHSHEMGAEASRYEADGDGPPMDQGARTQVARVKAIMGGGAGRGATAPKPSGRTAESKDQDFIIVRRGMVMGWAAKPKIQTCWISMWPRSTTCHLRAQNALQALMLFHNLDKMTLRRIVSEMYEKSIPAGDILIQQVST